MKRYPLLILCLIALAGCGERKAGKETNAVVTRGDSVPVTAGGIPIFDFEAELSVSGPADTATLNSIARKIDFVVLEETEKSVITHVSSVRLAYCDNGFLVSGTYGGKFFPPPTPLMLFGHDGSYIKDVIRIGRGPREVINTRFRTYNAPAQTVVIDGATKIVKYDARSDSYEDIPSQATSLEMFLLNDGSYVYLPPRFDTKNSPYLTYLGPDGRIAAAATYRGKRRIYSESPEGEWNGPVESYKATQNFTGDVLFQDMYNDTIYRISCLEVMEPHLLLKRGKLMPNINDAQSREKKESKLFFNKISESEKYLFVWYIYKNLPHNAIFEKSSGRLVVNTASDWGRAGNITDDLALLQSRHFIRYRAPSGKLVMLGISDVRENKIYCVARASDVRDFVPGLDEYSNPVVVVAELR